MNKFFKTVFLFISMTFLCCIITKNTFATDFKKSNIRSSYIESIDFQTYTPNQIYSNQTLLNYQNTSVYTAEIEYNQALRASSLILKTQNSLSHTSSDYWHIKIYAYVSYDHYRGSGSLIPTFLCPAFSSSGSIIDSCDITYHDSISNVRDELIGINENYFINNINGYYAVEINGHFTSSGSGNALSLSGPYLSVYNPTGLTSTFNWLLSFSRLEIFEKNYQESETDKAAEKELEDRNNIESQQSSTDSRAESSSQDFGAATTNISGVISTFISNLNNLNANNCTLPEIAAYGFSIGEINLCTYSPPNWIQGVTTAIISLITLRLAWHLFKRIMGIAKGLAGSK